MLFRKAQIPNLLFEPIEKIQKQLPGLRGQAVTALFQRMPDHEVWLCPASAKPVRAFKAPSRYRVDACCQLAWMQERQNVPMRRPRLQIQAIACRFQV